MHKNFLCLALSFLVSPLAYADGATMTHALVKSNTMIMGPLVADHSNFEGDLTVTSGKTVLSATKVKGLLTIKSDKEAPLLKLHCGSKIAKGVTFIGKPGMIKKSSDSIVEGQVINGKIENLPAGEKCK